MRHYQILMKWMADDKWGKADDKGNKMKEDVVRDTFCLVYGALEEPLC